MTAREPHLDQHWRTATAAADGLADLAESFGPAPGGDDAGIRYALALAIWHSSRQHDLPPIHCPCQTVRAWLTRPTEELFTAAAPEPPHDLEPENAWAAALQREAAQSFAHNALSVTRTRPRDLRPSLPAALRRRLAGIDPILTQEAAHPYTLGDLLVDLVWAREYVGRERALRTNEPGATLWTDAERHRHDLTIALRSGDWNPTPAEIDWAAAAADALPPLMLGAHPRTRDEPDVRLESLAAAAPTLRLALRSAPDGRLQHLAAATLPVAAWAQRLNQDLQKLTWGVSGPTAAADALDQFVRERTDLPAMLTDAERHLSLTCELLRVIGTESWHI